MFSTPFVSRWPVARKKSSTIFAESGVSDERLVNIGFTEPRHAEPCGAVPCGWC